MGIKSGTVPPGSEGVCSPPYQLHGGVILFPAPQHHAHLTSGRGGKGGRKKEKKGEGAEAPARAPGRSGPSRPVVVSTPAPPGIPSARGRLAPAPAAAERARGSGGGGGLCLEPGARAARLACLPRSLPAGLPASAKSNNSPCVRAPAPRSAEAAGAATGWGRESGPPGSPPPRRPAGSCGRPAALGWAG